MGLLRRQKPESAKDPLTIALEKWESNLQKAKCPQDYLPFLLSNLEFVEKAKILRKVAKRKGLPNNLFQNPEGVEKVACQLQRTGLSDLSRLLWYFLYHQKEHSDDFLGWCVCIILLDLRIRRLVQWKIHVGKELGSRRKELELDPPPEKCAEIELVIGQKEKLLEKIGKAYDRLCRSLWHLQEHMPSGPLRRAFLNWRSNPYWYLCDWLRRECASRGGCCGRSCGCCEKPGDTDQVLNRGHCTSRCSCCIETHRKTEDDAFKEKLDVLITFFAEKDNMYARRFCRAYIWGTDVLNEIEDEEEFKSEALVRDIKAGNEKKKWKLFY
jgi:hypothetical protein